jgi:hypothetical protein
MDAFITRIVILSSPLPGMTRLPSSTPRGGSSRDAKVYHHFNYIQEAGKATKTAICLQCGIPRAENSTRQRAHLKLECPEYLSYMQTNGHMSSIVREIYALWSNSGALSKHIQQIPLHKARKSTLLLQKLQLSACIHFRCIRVGRWRRHSQSLVPINHRQGRKSEVRFQIRLSRRFDSVFGMRFGSLETLLTSSPTEARILMETVFKTLVLLLWMACHSTGIPLI